MAVGYPLRFQPLLRRYLWGGRRLETILGKPLGQGNDYAESWEIVDHNQDQSRVLAGPLQGRTLGELVALYSEELLGRRDAPFRFPLLMKFLDAHSNLSVQVHPDDAQAATLSPPDLGKTEAWVVLHAEPASRVYAGLKPGVDRLVLQRELRQGTVERCLHGFEPEVGDCIFIPAGMVHALGAGLVVAEIQQASDTTFRLFDWNRPGPDGQPRRLHIAQALDTINYRHGPAAAQIPQTTGQSHTSRLITCDKFTLDRWELDSAETIGGDGRFHILAVLQGTVRLDGDPLGQPLATGQTALLPADAGKVRIVPEEKTVLLDAYA